MKIRNDHLQALQQQQGETRAKPKTGDVFDTLLAEQLQAAQGTAGSVSSASPFAGRASALLSPTLAGITGEAAKGADPEGMSLDQLSQTIGSMLESMDAYAASLSSSEKADLKSAYGILQKMTGDIKAVQQAMPHLAEQHAGLAAMVNELDVLATTETFKFNRGDYL